MARHQSDNTWPLMALVAAEIAVLLVLVAVSELRASGPTIFEHRWSPVLPRVALVGKSAATYIMDSGRGIGSHPDPPRNTRCQFTSRRRKDDELPR